MTKEYETQLYKDNTKFLLIFIVLDLTLIGLFVYLGRLYDSNLLGIFLPFFLLILPIILSKKIKNDFKRNATLNFSETTFCVRLFSPKTKTTTSEEYLWNDINAFRFYFSPKLTTSLTIYLKNRKKRTFIFLDKKNYEESVEKESVLSNFLNYVKKVNQDLPEEKKIRLTGGFMVSKMAGFLIYIEISLIIVAFLLHLIHHKFGNSYYLILAIGFLIPQIVNRIQNKAIYNKINRL